MSKLAKSKKLDNIPRNNKGQIKGITIRGKTSYPRNKPCPCKSGLKYKMCCLLKEWEEKDTL